MTTYGCGYWLRHVSMTAQQMASSSTSHVSVSESTDSEQPTESSDIPSTASSSMTSTRPISRSNLIDRLHAKISQYILRPKGHVWDHSFIFKLFLHMQIRKYFAPQVAGIEAIEVTAWVMFICRIVHAIHGLSRSWPGFHVPTSRNSSRQFLMVACSLQYQRTWCPFVRVVWWL